MASIGTVHVVFKTHLDIGFTALASEVRRAYTEELIPKAIRLARELEAAGGPARFVWTTGSWLIDDYLRTAPPAQVAAMEAAIRDGHIAWHALPFTTHSEMMDAGLFRHGLSIAKRLDERFGRTTVAAKMTDVPGHSVGIVPLLAEAGVRYLHIGTNPASATPQVPAAFRWRAADGSEVVVNYAASYGSNEGEALVIPGLDHAVYFAQTNDNHGPPSAESIIDLFALLARRYPGAVIRAATIDDFARPLWEARETLPVVESEIGDTWIHGIASDPTQVRHFRTLQRLRRRWVDDESLVPGTTEHDAFSSTLLLVPEHTWGMDQKRYLPDYVSWSKPAFAAARATDVIDPAHNPAALSPYVRQSDAGAVTGWTYRAYEASWAEQRAYVDEALTHLDPARAAEARASMKVTAPERARGASLALEVDHHLGSSTVRFGRDGSIISLVDLNGRVLADDDHPLAVYHYQTYDTMDYDSWLAGYLEDLTANDDWAVPDFGKPGMADADPVPCHTRFDPAAERATLVRGTDADVVVVDLHPGGLASRTHGAPDRLELRYTFPHDRQAVEVVLSWSGKDAYRLPESSWLGFHPVVEEPRRWRLDKLGIPVDPLDVVAGGNRSLHAVDTGAHYDGPDGSVTLLTSDAALIAPGRQRLLVFDDAQPDLAHGFQVNLHNNVWGTNFRMWFEEDASFRFELRWD